MHRLRWQRDAELGEIVIAPLWRHRRLDAVDAHPRPEIARLENADIQALAGAPRRGDAERPRAIHPAASAGGLSPTRAPAVAENRIPDAYEARLVLGPERARVCRLVVQHLPVEA